MNNLVTEISTKRLKLRKICIDDLYDMYEYTSDKEVTKYLEWDAHTDISQTEFFIGQAINDSNKTILWGIELVKEKKLIGVVKIFDLSPKNLRAEVSYILNPKYHGNGYMVDALKEVFKYCFDFKNINRIQAKCTIDNNGSENVMKKLGMHKEATMHQFFIIRGKKIDALLYSILAAEMKTEE